MGQLSLHGVGLSLNGDNYVYMGQLSLCGQLSLHGIIKFKHGVIKFTWGS